MWRPSVPLYFIVGGGKGNCDGGGSSSHGDSAVTKLVGEMDT